MNELISYGSQQGFQKLKLEAAKDNATAINLYKDFGFKMIENKHESIILELILDNNNSMTHLQFLSEC